MLKIENNIDAKHDWICLSADDYWNSNPHSRYHIAKEFSKNSRVLWVNSIGHRFPSLKNRKGWLLIARKIKSYFIFYRRPENNFYVLSAITIPLFEGNFVKIVNAKLLWIQIKLVSFLIGIKGKYYFISSPSFGVISSKLKNSFVVYYYSDLYTSFRELKQNNNMEELDTNLVSIAKIVYGASKKICDNLNARGIKAKYLPHAVDSAHFENPNEFIPDSMKEIRRPIIGYYGTITDSNDWDLIDYLSEQRPNYSFVFIGKKLISNRKLESRENIHFLGYVPYKLIPKYGKCFDVAIMFWVLRDWIQHSNPLKLLEYMALGKPIVSIDIPEVKNNFGDVVFIAKDKYSFLEFIDKALKVDSKELHKKYKHILKEYSWHNITNQINNDIKEIKNV